METQITRPVEDALSGLEGVRNIQSSVSLGVSTTAIEFEIGEMPRNSAALVITIMKTTWNASALPRPSTLMRRDPMR